MEECEWREKEARWKGGENELYLSHKQVPYLPPHCHPESPNQVRELALAEAGDKLISGSS